MIANVFRAGMAELADAQDLGSCEVIRKGSTPFTRTKKEKHEFPTIKRNFVLFFLFFALQNIAKQGKNWLKSYAKLTQLTQKLRTF